VTQPPEIRVLLLTDGRPGHYHLAEGVTAAVARLRPVIVERLEVHRPRWMPGRVLSGLLNAGVSPALLLQHVYGVRPASMPASDLVVSAGGDTLAANICAARLLGARNIFYGSLRRFRPEDFALVLTSYARNAARPNSAMTLKPSKLDADALGPAPKLAPGQAPRLAGLLIGGNAGGFTYMVSDWERLLALIGELHRAHGTRWIVSNSPRTDERVSDRLAQVAADAAGPIAEFIDVRRAGAGTLAGLFARAEAIVVTADSSSMVSEAVWSRRPTVALMPGHGRLTADEQSYRDHLEREGWCRTLALDTATSEKLMTALTAIRPLSVNPLDHLAALLRRRIPELFGDASRAADQASSLNGEKSVSRS